ncbi:MAG: 50S ribosomal protein L25/general stress protein Ctc [Cytophagales bacterium]
MKKVEIIGFKRANLGKLETQQLRDEAQVPCVLYGGKEQLHFSLPMFMFRDIVYTPSTYIYDLQVGKSKFECVLKDVQYHPVNETILHADFFELNPEKEVCVNIPLVMEGSSVGAQKGGKLVQTIQKLKVKALPKNLPDFVKVDVTPLDLGKVSRVRDIKTDNYQILNPAELPVAKVLIPRGLKGNDKK